MVFCPGSTLPIRITRASPLSMPATRSVGVAGFPDLFNCPPMAPKKAPNSAPAAPPTASWKARPVVLKTSAGVGSIKPSMRSVASPRAAAMFTPWSPSPATASKRESLSWFSPTRREAASTSRLARIPVQHLC